MKKSLTSILTTALVIGATTTTFAASNPFSDVPADHWAYDAVTQLAADGVIEGYGDDTFRGQRNITRYEMAQMIAKAMARTDLSAQNKALLDKLAAEFADELKNLGVRVANLERNADMVKWTGEARYTYRSLRYDDNGTSDKYNFNELRLRLEPTAEVNDHWKVKARLDAYSYMDTDNDTDKNGFLSDGSKLELSRVYAEGNYNNFTVQLGKVPLVSPEAKSMAGAMVFDKDESFSGAKVILGDKFKAILEAGRYSNYPATDAVNFQGIELQYDDRKFSGGAAYYRLNGNHKSYETDDIYYTKEATNSIWSVNLGYRFGGGLALYGAYAKSSADIYESSERKAWQAILQYKGADPAVKGSWGIYTGYRHLGAAAAVSGTDYDANLDMKGWVIGANYTPMKNVMATVKYGDGKLVYNPNIKEKQLFARIECFF